MTARGAHLAGTVVVTAGLTAALIALPPPPDAAPPAARPPVPAAAGFLQPAPRAAAPSGEPAPAPRAVTPSPEPAPARTDAPPAAPPQTPDVAVRPVAAALPQPAPAAPVSLLAASGIPTTALDAYTRAAAAAPSGCHIGWPLLAAIGRVESNHGRFGGAVLHTDGLSTPPIIGIPLDGAGTALIRDTDHGRLDGDPVFDRAVGPMQFIPSTWAAYAVDGNGDGRSDPFNIFDAAAAATRYLCAAGGDLASQAAQVRAVLAYNHSDSYVTTVLRLAATYAGTPPPELPTPVPGPAPLRPPVNPGPPPALPAVVAAPVVPPPTPAVPTQGPPAEPTPPPPDPSASAAVPALAAPPGSTAAPTQPSTTESPTTESPTTESPPQPATVTNSPSETPSPTPTSTPTSAATPTPSPTPTPTPSPTSAATPTSSPTPTSTPSPTSAATPTPSPTSTATPTPTPSPTPTSTPSPSPTPTPPAACAGEPAVPLTVDVVDHTGTEALAAEVADRLKSGGITVDTVTSSSGPATSAIDYPESQRLQAERFAAALDATRYLHASDVPTVTVVLGSAHAARLLSALLTFTGLPAPTCPPESAPAASATTPTG